MRETLSPLTNGAEPVRPPAEPWAFSVNETARGNDVAITLFSFCLVGDFARVMGLVRIDSPADLRLASVPELAITSPGAQPLVLLSAHLLPHGNLAWVSWLYRRPAEGVRDFVGRIEQIEFGSQGSRRPPERQAGPWAFRFSIPAAPEAAAVGRR